MKLVLLLLSILIFSCSNEDAELKKAKELIKSQREQFVRDSTEIEHKKQIKIAKIRAGIVGDKDTLTDEEWMKKAEKHFKQQP